MKTRRAFEIISFLLILFAASAFVNAQCVPASTAAGALDTCFDGDGKVTTDITPNNDYARAVIIQPDGKIVVAGLAGESASNNENDFAVVRYNTNGSLDTTFDGDGIVVTDFSVSTNDGDWVEAMALQPDGKIIVAGHAKSGSDTAFALARYNADGSLDTTFDGDGKAELRLPTILMSLTGMVLQPDGKILVSGNLFSGDNFFSIVARFNSNGSIDNSFDGDGYACCTLNSAYGIALQQDDKIVIAGSQGFTTMALARYNSNGSRDMTFGSNGVITYQTGNGFDQPWTMGIRFDGSIIVGGNSRNSQNVIYGSLFRVGIDGTPGPSMLYNTEYAFWTLTFQPDGKILTGGNGLNVSPIFTVRRFNDVNIPDTAFNGGAVRVKFLPEVTLEDTSGVHGITIRNNRIVAAGSVAESGSTNQRFAVARLFSGLRPPHAERFDFDGDGKADVAVYRASTARWYIFRSSDSGVTEKHYYANNNGEIPVPADYDGDGITDVSVFNPGLNRWAYLSSISADTEIPWNWGTIGDIALPSDFDGDGRADYIVYRPSENFWYRINNVGITSFGQFGLAGDKPVIGDFDGDGKSDKAIYRPSTGDWWWQSSADNGQRATHWGISTDIPVPADYDGDGKTDFAVYRPSTGVWYIVNSGNLSYAIMSFGLAEDKPVPADYDGDGKVDVAVYRPSSGTWYLLRSTAGFAAAQFGISTDVPLPNAYIQ